MVEEQRVSDDGHVVEVCRRGRSLLATADPGDRKVIVSGGGERAMRGERSTRLRDAALSIAASGWPVFPLWARTKRPVITDWEHGATSDPARIARWWRDAPYNIGIACAGAGLVVVDLDQGRGEPPPEDFPGAAGGVDVLEALAVRAGQPAPWRTYTVSTPSGGLHLYFAAPEGQPLRNTAGTAGAGLGWKIDTRAHGGYVVAAGSVGPAGMYRVVNNEPVAALPQWLADALAKPLPSPAAPSAFTAGVERSDRRASAYVRAIVEDEAQAVRTAAVGTRNHTLNRAAWTLGRLVGGGELTEEDARVALEQGAAGHVGTTGFTAEEAHRTINSGLDAGRREPRRIGRNSI